jgi:hypothetical protein
MEVQTQRKDIREVFLRMQTKQDLVKLINLANSQLYKDSKPINLGTLYYYADPEKCKKRYKSFEVPKKSGGIRKIHAPVKGLKNLLRTLNYIIQSVHTPHMAATGFVPGMSIVKNAKVHANTNYVFNLDLKDFFHSFDHNGVKMGFYGHPFDLKEDKMSIAYLLASLCTHPFEVVGELKRVLPQGSPTSPAITNILCYRLDRRLKGMADRFGLRYTRYADDITFSSMHNVYNKDSFNDELVRIIYDHGLKINPAKTRLQKRGYRQEVTGIVVNQKPNVKRKYVKDLRKWLYLWESYGYEKAEAIFRKDYQKDKGHVKKRQASLENVLSGKLDYLKMVKGEKDGTYRGLKERLDLQISQNSPLNDILDIWENEGIDKAMEEYYKNK